MRPGFPALPKECQTLLMIWQHHHLPQVSSTNRWALEWLRMNVPQGPVLFTTDHQTEGRGQRERRWSSEAGRDVCLSVAFPVQEGWKPAEINMQVALAVRETMLEHLPASQSAKAVQVKWPNDMLIWHAGEYRKVAGILVENMWRGSQWAAAVVGVGINVDSSRLTRSYPAVSLTEAWNVAVDPATLARFVGEHLVRRLSTVGNATSKNYHEALFARGETRTFVVHEREWRGRLMEINEEGLGRFEWEVQPEVADMPPAEWLPSSEVQWCW